MSSIESFVIENEVIKVTILNYGATIHSIYHKTWKHNALLSFANFEDYTVQTAPYLNAVVGPVAGRIAYGRYSLDGREYLLSTQEEINHLHGGSSGISRQYFQIKQISSTQIQCTLSTNHDQDGFHGIFHYGIKYSLDGTSLIMEFGCTPSQRTILNMTSHCYFNLSKDMSESIESTYLTIHANQRMTVHNDGYPDKVVPIMDDDPFDFRKGKTIQSLLKSGHPEIELSKGFNTPYILDNHGKIILSHNDRKVVIETDSPSAVFYSANYFDDSLQLNHNQSGYPSCGLVVECQDIPNGINVGEDQNKYVYSPARPYSQVTKFIFE